MNTEPPKRYYIAAPASDPTTLRVIPELAKQIGLNESIMLLQLDFWIRNSDNQADNHYWTYQSLRDLHKKAFSFWGIETINRTLKSLIEQGLLLEGNFNKHAYDKTRWFALNPDGLRKLQYITVVEVAMVTGGVSQNETGVSQNETTIPETTTIDKEEKTIAPATQDAPVVTKKKTPKPIHPLNQKDDIGQNPYFNLVLQYSFTANPNSKADSNGIGGRVGKVLAKLIPLYDELGGFTPAELEAAYQRLRQDKGAYMATDAEKVYGQLSPYLRRLVTENNTLPAAPVVKPRPDITPRVGTRRLDALQPLMPRKES